MGLLNGLAVMQYTIKTSVVQCELTNFDSEEDYLTQFPPEFWNWKPDNDPLWIKGVDGNWLAINRSAVDD